MSRRDNRVKSGSNDNALRVSEVSIRMTVGQVALEFFSCDRFGVSVRCVVRPFNFLEGEHESINSLANDDSTRRLIQTERLIAAVLRATKIADCESQ